MSETPNGRTAQATGYIRGGSATSTEPRNVMRIVFLTFVICMVALIVVLAVEAARHNSRTQRLSDHGVPVQVRVTSCIGSATGTGITVNGYTCRGTYTLDGQRHSAILRGLNTHQHRGVVVAGVADPQSPGTLSTPDLVASSDASWRAYVGAGVTAIILLLGVAAYLLWSRRGSIDEPPSTPARGDADNTRPVPDQRDTADPSVSSATGVDRGAIFTDASGSVAAPSRTWQPYVVPGVAVVLVVAGLACVARHSRRSD